MLGTFLGLDPGQKLHTQGTLVFISCTAAGESVFADGVTSAIDGSSSHSLAVAFVGNSAVGADTCGSCTKISTIE